MIANGSRLDVKVGVNGALAKTKKNNSTFVMSNQFPRHQSQDISKNSKTNPRDVVVTYHRLNYIALHY